jgi:hypothetical protein
VEQKFRKIGEKIQLNISEIKGVTGKEDDSMGKHMQQKKNEIQQLIISIEVQENIKMTKYTTNLKKMSLVLDELLNQSKEEKSVIL